MANETPEDAKVVSQLKLYKLVESLSDGKFKNASDLLNDLLISVVDSDQFDLVGGRIWEFVPEKKAYILRSQYGEMSKIPDGYTLKIENNPFFSKVTAGRTYVKLETDEVLKESGIRMYSATGVGDRIKSNGKKYYQYILGFNAKESTETFYETLTIISGVATSAIKNLVSQNEQEKIRKDIKRAAEIQANILPDHKYRFSDFDIYGVCIPDSKVGGDYFDYIKNEDGDEERLGIVVGDAASKGLPAAIQALFVSGALRMGVSFGTKLSQLFAKLNKLVWRTFVFERFVTLCYCELHLSQNRLVLYANAGHCAPIHYRPKLDSFVHLDPTGGLLGLMENQKYRIENIRMHQGDVLVMYTDGITESQSRDGEQFGEERLHELIKKNHAESAKNIALLIIEAVEKFTVESHYNDDKTIVVIKRDEQA
ncbi:MAG: PP2C family protein-serine/threonine phosphatase [Candidatus Kapabacteria bacterium]|nr:PP2C family protein-serine/threonine phosphatase [Candidatus Kapabacteria bacterium]